MERKHRYFKNRRRNVRWLMTITNDFERLEGGAILIVKIETSHSKRENRFKTRIWRGRKEVVWSKRREEWHVTFEINCIIKPGALLCPNLKEMKWMLNSFAGEKIVSCCTFLYFLFSAGFSKLGSNPRSCVANSVWWRALSVLFLLSPEELYRAGNSWAWPCSSAEPVIP